MKTFKDIISEVAQPKGGDEKAFKAKHVIQKINHPAAEDDQFTGGPSAKKDKSKKASYKEGEDEAVYEETDKEDDMCPECGESYDECECDGEEMEEAKMSDADMKQRENIVKGMKKSKADLQARYGDKWKSVMYATATKKAMEAVELDEISKDLAKSYYRKATKDIGPRAGSAQGSRDDAYRSRRRARDNYQVSSLGTRKTTDDDKAAHNARADRAISNAKNQERKIKNRAVGMSRASARMESVELDANTFANILEAMNSPAKGSTAQYGPSDATRDTLDKQLDTRKGEKDFVASHEVETPEFADGVQVNNKTFADAGKAVKVAPKRPNDSSIGDKKPVENDGK